MHRSTATCIRTAVVAAVLAAAAGTPLLAQETGVVRGTVTLEATGGSVHGAVILVVGSGTFGLTDEQGRFEIDGVPPGEYEVVAQREYLTAGRRTVIVESGEAATADFALSLSPVREEVTVTASAGGTETALEAFNAVTTLEAFDVARESVSDLASALEHEPGIAIRGFGPGANRPIIRGFDGDRVLILQDGIRTGDLSGESGDHGVAIDPNSAERIELVRGPAALLYGSNAVGGVVNVVTPHAAYRESRLQGTRGQFGADLGSANAQAGANAALQHAGNGVHYWAAGSTRRTEDYTTPEGTVENSAMESTGAGGRRRLVARPVLHERRRDAGQRPLRRAGRRRVPRTPRGRTRRTRGRTRRTRGTNTGGPRSTSTGSVRRCASTSVCRTSPTASSRGCNSA